MADNKPGRIADKIRDEIIRGSLAPGSHLLQSELIDQSAASRGTIREALKLLAAEGLIVHDPNRGFFIAKISASEATQLYRLRALVERELIETMEWPDETQLARLETLIADIERNLQDRARLEWVQSHRRFHVALFQLSRAEVIVSECLRLWQLTDRYRSLLPGPYAVEARWAPTDERKILEALKLRDRALLLRVIDEDRERVKNLIIETIKFR